MRRQSVVAVLALAVGSLVAGGTATGSANQGAFRVTDLPSSTGGTEPSLAVDSKGRIFVSPIFGLGNLGVMGTPVWRSTDVGRTFTKHRTAHAGPAGTPLGGGDSALITDKRDYVYATDLWLGNDSIAVSTDHGDTWTGSPASHRVVGDRNWLAYSRVDDSLYQLWNAVDGLYIARADLGTPLAQNAALSFPYNYRVAGEIAGVPGSYTRANSAWPGGVAVDQREGAVYATWSDQLGLAIARSEDKGATWTIGHLPGTKVTGAWYDTAWNFAPVGVDAKGNVFVAWAQLTGTVSDPESISIYVAVSKDAGRSWRKTKVATRRTALFPTMAVLGVDRVGVAWIDTTTQGNPNSASAFGDARWRLQYGELTGLAGRRVRAAYATVDRLVHDETVFVGTQTPEGADRGMGDFMSMAALPHGGVAIAYTRAVDGKAQPRLAVRTAPLRPSGR